MKNTHNNHLLGLGLVKDQVVTVNAAADSIFFVSWDERKSLWSLCNLMSSITHFLYEGFGTTRAVFRYEIADTKEIEFRCISENNLHCSLRSIAMSS